MEVSTAFVLVLKVKHRYQRHSVCSAVPWVMSSDPCSVADTLLGGRGGHLDGKVREALP